MSTNKYIKQFKARVLVVEIYRGSFSQEPKLLKDELKKAGVVPAAVPPANQDLIVASTVPELAVVEVIVHANVLTAVFINGASSKRFKPLMDNIANQSTFGQDNYPTTLEDAVHLFNNYKGSGVVHQVPQYDEEEA